MPSVSSKRNTPRQHEDSSAPEGESCSPRHEELGGEQPGGHQQEQHSHDVDRQHRQAEQGQQQCGRAGRPRHTDPRGCELVDQAQGAQGKQQERDVGVGELLQHLSQEAQVPPDHGRPRRFDGGLALAHEGDLASVRCL